MARKVDRAHSVLIGMSRILAPRRDKSIFIELKDQKVVRVRISDGFFRDRKNMSNDWRMVVRDLSKSMTKIKVTEN